MRTYNQRISKIKQTEKQRQSSMIAEAKWGRRNPLEFTNDRVLLKKSAFAQNIMMNRQLKTLCSLNNVNNLHDYTSTMHEVKKAA